MKLLHFSDLHLDYKRMDDYLHTLDSIIDFAEQEKVDAVLFGGDAFHRPNPLPDLLYEFSKRLQRMASFTPVVICVGNHDQKSVDGMSVLHSYHALNMENVFVGIKPETFSVKGMDVSVYPYPKKKKWEQVHEEINMLASNQKQGILLAHLTVEGSIYGAEREYLLGIESECTLDEIDQEAFSYIGLGHIHKYQKIKKAFYSGSVERVSFNEENQEKGVILWDEGKVEFVSIDARKFLTLRGSTEELVQKIEETDLSGVIVRAIISGKEDEVIPENSLIKDMYARGAFEASCRVDRTRILRPKVAGDFLDNMSKSSMELLELYFKSTKQDFDPELKNLATEIMELANDEQRK